MLEKLKEYKELIAIIVFFIGGFIWLTSQFPTKNDLTSEINSLNCLLEKYMTLTQLQIQNQEFEKQAQKLADRICQMRIDGQKAPLTPAMKFELEQMESELDHNQTEHRTNTKEIEGILAQLARNVCKKVPK
jgi:flagellar motor component MotA